MKNLPILNTYEDYALWYLRLRGYLLMKGLWSVSDPGPAASDQPQSSPRDDKSELPDCKRDANRALGTIILSLGPNIIHISSSFDDPRELLREIRRRAMPSERQRLHRRTQELVRLRLQPGETLRSYFTRFDAIADELSVDPRYALGRGARTLMSMVGLPPDYQTVDVTVRLPDDLDEEAVRRVLFEREFELRLREISQPQGGHKKRGGRMANKAHVEPHVLD